MWHCRRISLGFMRNLLDTHLRGITRWLAWSVPAASVMAKANSPCCCFSWPPLQCALGQQIWSISRCDLTLMVYFLLGCQLMAKGQMLTTTMAEQLDLCA